MECNNKYCVFNAFDSCCHETKEGFENAIPNELNCPSSVRSDIQNNLSLGIIYVLEEITNKNHEEINEIFNLMEKQKKSKKG